MNAYQRAIELLTPYFRNRKEREYWLDLAFFGNDELTGKIEYEGSAGQFAVHCVRELRNHGDVDGRPALAILLETVGSKQGVSKQKEFQALVAELEGRTPAKPQPAEQPSSSDHEVFISYSRRDSDSVQAIRAHLEQNGIACWLDTSDITGGDRWERMLEAALTTAKIVVCAVSEHAKNSEWVSRELQFAESNGKTIIPARIEDVSLPLRLNTLQAIDCFGAAREANLQKLVEAIKKKIG
jgi:hypothetical protein